jgi:hypothetical protein
MNDIKRSMTDYKINNHEDFWWKDIYKCENCQHEYDDDCNEDEFGYELQDAMWDCYDEDYHNENTALPDTISHQDCQDWKVYEIWCNMANSLEAKAMHQNCDHKNHIYECEHKTIAEYMQDIKQMDTWFRYTEKGFISNYFEGYEWDKTALGFKWCLV